MTVTVTRTTIAITVVPWWLPWWAFVPRAWWWARKYGLRYDGMMRFHVGRRVRYVSPAYSSHLGPPTEGFGRQVPCGVCGREIEQAWPTGPSSCGFDCVEDA